MKKINILSLFSAKGTLVGLVVLAGFILNFAFTVTPTKTEAVFGSQDSSYRFVLSQSSGAVVSNDSLGIDPGDSALQDTVSLEANSVVTAEGIILLPAKGQ